METLSKLLLLAWIAWQQSLLAQAMNFSEQQARGPAASIQPQLLQEVADFGSFPAFSSGSPAVEANGAIQFLGDDTFAIQHMASGRCLRPSDPVAPGAQLAFTDDCATALVKFTITPSGGIQHAHSALCLRPENTKDWVSLSTLCVDDYSKFLFQDGASIQNVASKKCVLPEALVNGSDVPAQGSRLVLQHNCNKNAAKFIQAVSTMIANSFLGDYTRLPAPPVPSFEFKAMPPSEVFNGSWALLPPPGPRIPSSILQPEGSALLVLDPRTDGGSFAEDTLLSIYNARIGRKLLACTEHRGYSNGQANPSIGYTWSGHAHCYLPDTWWAPGARVTTRRADMVGWWFMQQPGFAEWIDGPSNYNNGLPITYGWCPPPRFIMEQSFARNGVDRFFPRVRPCKATFQDSEFIGQQVIGIDACSFSLIAWGSNEVVTVTSGYQLLAYKRDYEKITNGGCSKECNGNYFWPQGDVGLARGDIWEGLFYAVKDAGACCALCRQTYGCTAWVFSLPKPFGTDRGEPQPGGCSLKDNKLRTRPGSTLKPIPPVEASRPGSCPSLPKDRQYDSMTGVVPKEFRRDPKPELRGCARDVQHGRHFNMVSMGSGRYWLKAVYTPTIRACCTLCKNTQGCNVFSFQRIWYQCYLYKTYNSSKIKNDNGFISGRLS